MPEVDIPEWARDLGGGLDHDALQARQGFTHLTWLHRAVREGSRHQTQRKAEPEMAVRGPGWAPAVGQTHPQANAGKKVMAHGPG